MYVIRGGCIGYVGMVIGKVIQLYDAGENGEGREGVSVHGCRCCTI